MTEQLKRLKELGWEDVTEVERAKLQSQGAECANDLCKAFEKAGAGIRYCYSEQDIDVFLEQVEAHQKST